jgi:hypothetical protein
MKKINTTAPMGGPTLLSYGMFKLFLGQ